MKPLPFPVPDEPAHDDAASIEELIARHAMLLGWLARLEQARAHAPQHVAMRVRDDYLARVRAVEAELVPQLDRLRAERDALAPVLATAAQRYAAAADALDEARLRYLAGELDEVAWLERAPALEAEARDAFTGREQLDARAAALRALVARLDGSAEAGAGPTAAAWEAGSGGGTPPADEDRLPWLELLEEAQPPPARFDEMDFLHWVAGDAAPAERGPPAGPPDAGATPEGGGDQAGDDDRDDEAAFLEELDRALRR